MVNLWSRIRESRHPRLFILAAILLSGVNSLGQQNAVPAAEPGIQDNSFLVEEAYNQNFGVVQHISSFTRFWNSKDWNYTFTQEWPVPGDERHQLSYTLAAVHSGDFPGSGAGFGDVLLNYRYQLVGSGDTRVAFSPRLSLIFPTGDSSQEQGAGSFGVQTSLPLSVVLNKKLVSHWNLGATYLSTRPGCFRRPSFIGRLQPGAKLYLAGAQSFQCHAGNCVREVTGRRGQRPHGMDELPLSQSRYPLVL